jgi:hypothetical protein
VKSTIKVTLEALRSLLCNFRAVYGKRNILTSGLAFALLANLSACASNPERPPVVRIVPVPAELTEQVAEPRLEGDTNAALVDWITRLQAAIREANRRLQSIGEIKP